VPPPLPVSVDRAAPAAEAPSLEPPATLEAEAQLIQAATRALRAGDARAALAALDDHARAFPRGVLAEERAAQRVPALCALGDTRRANDEAAAFVHAYPHSPLAPRMRAACGDATPK